MSLQEANDCMFYSANSLLKSAPNFNYGFFTWVFNPKIMTGRYFYEPWDIGMIQEYYKEVPDSYSDAFGVGEEFFHTLQEWQTVVNYGRACNKSTNETNVTWVNATLATVMNRWYAPGDELPTNCGLGDAPYNEMIVLGTVHLED